MAPREDNDPTQVELFRKLLVGMEVLNHLSRDLHRHNSRMQDVQVVDYARLVSQIGLAAQQTQKVATAIVNDYIDRGLIAIQR